MGRITVETTIENGTDSTFRIRCDVLVDMGAAYLTLPAAWRDRLGPLMRLDTVAHHSSSDGSARCPTNLPGARAAPRRELLAVDTASQAVVTGEICGPVLLRLARFRPVLADVLFIEMDPLDGPYEPLIGYIPLEQAQAAVDLEGHRLVKVSHVDLK